MRITTASMYETSVQQLQRRQQQLADSQTQLTSGKRVLRASDDPADAARAERALAMIARSDANQRALDASRNAMQLTEGALGNSTELLQQARELIASAGNGSFSDAERKTVAEALRGLRNDLLSVANRSDGAGLYLFGGQGSDSAPLVDGVGGVSYVGAPGQLSSAAGEASPLSVDGQAAWLGAPDPANPGSSLSVFGVLDGIISSLATPGQSSAVVAQTVREGLGSVDAVVSNLTAWRSRAGEALARVEAAEQRISQTKLDAQRDRSSAEDLDMVAAISDFQNRQSGYDAALRTFSVVQRLSLFEYIR
jgi:flagellar hook-associated protein 3 FlgL